MAESTCNSGGGGGGGTQVQRGAAPALRISRKRRRCIGKSVRSKFVVITVYGSEFIDETERPKNQVMRAIETLSKDHMWEIFWHIFAPVYF